MTSAKPAILVLIPDARLRDIYLSRFERAGWEAEAASGLVDAERRAVQLRPAVLLIYFSLLENVKAAFKRLHSLPTLQKTRIVIADKYIDQSTVHELLEAGAAQVVMTAHLTPQDLVDRMNNLIEDSL